MRDDSNTPDKPMLMVEAGDIERPPPPPMQRKLTTVLAASVVAKA